MTEASGWRSVVDQCAAAVATFSAMRPRSRLFLIAFALIALSASTASAAAAYDGAAAAAYADTYWQSYNPAWPSFARKGGDCTNFVSQALDAGGIAMRPSPLYSGDAAWYMARSKGNHWSYALSWINAQDQSIFALQHLPGVTQVADYTGVAPGEVVSDNAAQGDIVLYDWNDDGVYDHEAIIVASSDGTTWDLVDAHTNNRYHAYWTLAQYNTSWATTHIVVLHIAATAG
jgi:hypothetical protein